MQRRPEPEYMDNNAEATAYADADFDEVNEAFVQRLLTFPDISDAPVVLDAGVGPGDIPLKISAVKPSWRFVGLDASMPMLTIGKAAAAVRGSESIAPVLGDVKWLPFADNCFDIIISNSILHHVADTGVFWAEVLRTAKPDAFLFVRDLCRPETRSEARLLVTRYAGTESELLQEEFYRSLLAAYTVAETQQQIKDAGLHAVTVIQTTDRHLDVYGRL